MEDIVEKKEGKISYAIEKGVIVQLNKTTKGTYSYVLRIGGIPNFAEALDQLFEAKRRLEGLIKEEVK